ncbi:MAG: 4a-hydroxytetrahydrobiopterin dehydratase [Acidobacteriota bacterium]|jgi:4a-hydroxytetrahydrobiopterin dehydratase
MKVLSQDEIKQKLGALRGWEITPAGIQKRYELDSFMSVIGLVNRVAEAAEKANHHPDMLINYDKVTFTLITHDAGGITQKDFDLASRIDLLAT